jgi:membrane protein DedA with SNARE-associated domain/rhodanese-related sulfurtransferase
MVQDLLQYGYLILFGAVMCEQMGMPIPATPFIVAAGTLVGAHKMAWPIALLCVIIACGISDTVWFMLGGRYGGKIIRVLCRISLEPGTCVRRTQGIFTKYGLRTMLWAKFVPGLNSVAAPIAGQSATSYPAFIIHDLAGAFLWGGTYIVAGALFSKVIERNKWLLHTVEHSAVLLVVLVIAAVFGYRVWKQNRFLKQVSGARLTPEELKTMLDAGERPYIVDLRHPLDYLPDPRVVPYAIRMLPDEVERRGEELPRDRDIILYCTCPSDASSAKTALLLRRQGIQRVRPLTGGFDAWKALGYPLNDYVEVTTAPNP